MSSIKIETIQVKSIQVHVHDSRSCSRLFSVLFPLDVGNCPVIVLFSYHNVLQMCLSSFCLLLTSGGCNSLKILFSLLFLIT